MLHLVQILTRPEMCALYRNAHALVVYYEFSMLLAETKLSYRIIRTSNAWALPSVSSALDKLSSALRAL